MSLQPKQRLLALDDFEEMLPDCPPDEKWELIGGRLVKMMVGARWEHNRIIQNVAAAMLADFRRRRSPCRPLVETFRLRQAFMDLSTLPDILVHCGQLEPGQTAVDAPVVLVEVASPGSENRDRFGKRPLYLRLPSLMHYVVIYRDAPLIEIDDRTGPQDFSARRAEGLDKLLSLPAIGFEMPVAAVYEDVLGVG